MCVVPLYVCFFVTSKLLKNLEQLQNTPCIVAPVYGSSVSFHWESRNALKVMWKDELHSGVISFNNNITYKLYCIFYPFLFFWGMSGWMNYSKHTTLTGLWVRHNMLNVIMQDEDFVPFKCKCCNGRGDSRCDTHTYRPHWSKCVYNEAHLWKRNLGSKTSSLWSRATLLPLVADPLIYIK